MFSAGVVGQQDDDDWRTVDAVEQERQTLACSSPLGSVELFKAHISHCIFFTARIFFSNISGGD